FGQFSATWNGILAAPTIANIDGDPDMELVVGTVSSGAVAYDLPGSANARVLWGTGRANFMRDGTIPTAPLRANFTLSGAPLLKSGDLVTVYLNLTNPTGTPINPLQFTNTLPANLTYAGGLTASSGSALINGSTITWNGTVGSGPAVVISYQAQI